jgi:hypothetical protein
MFPSCGSHKFQSLTVLGKLPYDRSLGLGIFSLKIAKLVPLASFVNALLGYNAISFWCTQGHFPLKAGQ